MYPTDTEILFPARVIPLLGKLRGRAWQTLVDKIVQLPEGHPDSLAFSLMMIRLDGCLNCQCDSYRAMRGCTHCALTTVSRYRGQDAELLRQYHSAQREVVNFLSEDGGNGWLLWLSRDEPAVVAKED